MSTDKNGNLRADGLSITLPLLGLGGTYYWNPGAPNAPRLTLTGGVGMGGGGVHAVHLRNGMSSQDTLGYGASGTVSTIFPSVTVNASIPDEGGIPQPWNARVSSIDAGIGLPGFGASYTVTPGQIAGFIDKYIFPPAMGPQDELSPFARTLQSGIARVGPSAEQSLPYVRALPQGSLGSGVAPWASDYLKGRFGLPSAATASSGSGSSFAGRTAPVPYLPDVSQSALGGLPGLIASVTGSASFGPSQFQPPAGGLLGMIQDYMRDNPGERGGSR